jgi:hypothetical protein
MAKPKRQPSLPTMEKKSLKDVDAAAERYCEIRDKRMRLTEDEIEARDVLLRAMQKHGLDSYVDEEASPPLEVRVVPGDLRVKVTRIDEADEV